MTEKIRRAPQRGDRDFHELDPQAANNLLINAVKENRITGDDCAHISAFANEIVASNGSVALAVGLNNLTRKNIGHQP